MSSSITSIQTQIIKSLDAQKKAAAQEKNALVVFVDSQLKLKNSSSPDGLPIAVSDLAKRAGFKAQAGDILTDYNSPVFQHLKGISALVLVGVGDNDKPLKPTQIQKCATGIIKSVAKSHEKITYLIDGVFNPANFEIFSLASFNATYHFDTYKAKKSDRKLTAIDFVSTDTQLADTLEFAKSIFHGQSMAKDLGNEPGNICFPAYMADQALALAKEFKSLKVDVIDEKQMEKLGMGCFLSISKGSDKEGKLITLEYNGGKADDAPIVLVGKGITFDTGGISLKPGPGMEEMKYDMCGSASVMGVMRALCEAKLPINVVGALACAENMPSAKATRPGDIVTSMSGLTVEILNTDAEGRLVLSDTLTYIGKYKPKYVIDIATLTGACVIAVGHVMNGLFSQDDELAANLLAASNEIHDRAWRLPLDDDYQELLDSPCADMQNIGGRPAGATTAACFLSRFTKEYRWAHLDIAGSAWVSGKAKGSTGRPVPMLMQFLKNESKL